MAEYTRILCPECKCYMVALDGYKCCNCSYSISIEDVETITMSLERRNVQRAINILHDEQERTQFVRELRSNVPRV